MQSEVDEETFLHLKKSEEDILNQVGHFGSPFRKKAENAKSANPLDSTAKKQEGVQDSAKKIRAPGGRDINELQVEQIFDEQLYNQAL